MKNKKIIVTSIIVLFIAAILIALKDFSGFEKPASNGENNQQVSSDTTKTPAAMPAEIEFSDSQIRLLTYMVTEELSSFVYGRALDTLYKRMNPMIRVSAQKLFSDYDDNEIKADSLYRDKELIVSWTIQSIDRGIGETYSLSLETENNGYNKVHAGFSVEYAPILAELHKGQIYVAHCICDGMLMHSPMLKDCKPIDTWIGNEVSSIIDDIKNCVNENSDKLVKDLKAHIEENRVMFAILASYILTISEDSPVYSMDFHRIEDSEASKERDKQLRGFLDAENITLSKIIDNPNTKPLMFDMTLKEAIQFVRTERKNR